ncbi:uncharacterized protein LOC133039086 [Cannabis sativa]|uniref:uncharacterized protein LOC133039086 n=1 Tax=Cannabis sativa TaxID=3483 RepID=UPI0029CA58FA|nr:uncharacterized protein LOC133039086 [Cannabis sativa]
MGLLINGSVQGTIKPTCGLHQGDPLSLALFITAADVLSRLITTRMIEGHIQGFKVSRDGPVITHLMFSDDVILFKKASVKEAKGFLRCLEDYCSWSGQAVNYQKSTVFFSKGVSSGLAREIAGILNMKRMKNDATYLGLPLFRSLNRSRDLRFLVDRALQRVRSWKTRLLSKAGKTCLIQSVGSALASYVAATEPISLNVARKPKLRGGLGFRTVEAVNKAFMTKWAWKALTDNTNTWSKVVQAKYLKGRNFLNLEKQGGESGMWKAILDSRGVLEKEWFGRDNAQAMLNIDLPNDKINDSGMWLGEHNGMFSIKSAYRMIKGHDPNYEEGVWKLIWSSPIHSRLKFL